MPRLVQTLRCVLVCLILLYAAKTSKANGLIDVKAVPGYSPWSPASPAFPGIQIQTLCACKPPNHVGSLTVIILSYYVHPADIDWTISYDSGAHFQGTTHLPFPGEPVNVNLPNYYANGLMTFSFNVRAEDLTINRSDNSFPYKADWSDLKQISNVDLLARVACIGYVSPLRVGRWWIQWQNASSQSVKFNWHATGYMTEARNTMIAVPGAFSAVEYTGLMCQPAPWDSGVFLVVTAIGQENVKH
jgi:hypothetical protein